MAEFIVVRHAEDAPKSDVFPIIHGSVDTPLIASGYEQAADTAEALRHHNIVAVHAPPLARTLSTGSCISRRIDKDVLVPDKTVLGRDMGVFARRGHTAMASVATETHYNAQGEPYFIEVPGAESLKGCYSRLGIAYSALVNKYKDVDGSVVIVTQHFAATLLRGIHDGIPLIEATEYGDLSHAGAARLVPGERSTGL